MSVVETIAEPIDLDRIAAIAARLDLREPNKEALESIVYEIARHYEIEREPPPLEAVIDVATGVGKTYILAAAIEYLAGEGVRNFAIITPGRTILEKTVANFIPGHPKSLLRGMEVEPVLITSENFASPMMRAAMDDPAQVKLFVFTVQALLKPESKVGRKTHKFQEGLGEAFYAHLQGLADLVVFADEHHTYYSPAFSRAIRDLTPRVLLGLTATPQKKTPVDQIIFRYPLAAAIADKLVKTPVIVGRKDDRSDPQTKLLDGVRLLDAKERLLQRWCAETGVAPVTPIMLVVAPSIAEAEEITSIVTDPAFAEGRFVDKVLTVHSNVPDEALAQLDRLEAPDNPYRIVISVGMLKEGWDVKNVYVIASLRASVSDILTEQTLGRGLRLPFGRYTGIELLDTLEVLGHERYEDLLRKKDLLVQQFIDHRTRAVLRRNAEGRLEPVTETTPVQANVVTAETITPSDSPAATPVYAGEAMFATVEDHTAKADAQVLALQRELVPRSDVPRFRIPVLKMTTVRSTFSLADITDLTPFRLLGERYAADPAGNLQRMTLGARIVQGPDGLRRTEIIPSRAMDTVAAAAFDLPLATAQELLLAHVLAAPAVPARASERYHAARIVEAFVQGLGPNAAKLLSAYLERMAHGLIQRITEEQRTFATKPSYSEVVEIVEFARSRIGRVETSDDRYGSFKKGVGYLGYCKSLYAQDWFDSSTERDVANILEDDDDLVSWVRLQLGDLPILWQEGRAYNPDFIAVDRADDHWLIEVKMDKEMASDEVQAKRQAARRWANYVSGDPKVGARWCYLLVSETDVRTAKRSWSALKALGSA